MPIHNVYDSRFDLSTHELDKYLDNLMPRSNPALKRTLLESNQTGMTSISLARFILRESNRVDVKACISEDRVNCYSLFFNLVGLSEDVAYSQTVVAITISAHEVGHALQPQFEKKLISLLGKTPILYVGRFTELVIFMITLLKSGILSDFKREIESYSIAQKKSQIQNEYIQYPEIDRDRQYLNQSQPPDRNYLVRAIGAIFKYGLTLLCMPLYCAILLAVIFLIIILIPPSICCLFICRVTILLTEIDASVRAMYILKHYKVLDVRQLKAARKFLIAAGFTYLRYCSGRL